MLIGCFLGFIVYYSIVIPRHNQDSSSVSLSTILLIGYGIVIPIALSVPFQIMDYLDVRNGSFRMGLCSIAMTVTLGCLEAMHKPNIGYENYYGRSRSSNSGNWQNYENRNQNEKSEEDNNKKSNNPKQLHPQRQQPTIPAPFAYAASIGLIVRPLFDGKDPTKLKPSTWQPFSNQLVKHVRYIGSFTIFYHLLYKYNFFPFETRSQIPANRIWVSLEVGQWYNTFIQAFVMNLVLGLSLSGVSALSSLLMLGRVQCDSNIIDNPMFASKSPSDFWGRRWNKLIHHGLKHGIYKPVRAATNNATIAAVSAFVFSGLLHEYVWSVLFYKTTTQTIEEQQLGVECCPSCYCDSWIGKQLLFFGWNGVLISLEYMFGNQISKLVQPVPQLLKSHLVVLLSLPVGHLFTADLTMSGFFEHMQQCLPFIKIVPIPTNQ